jgi:uncharacterized protein (DUF1697 family)
VLISLLRGVNVGGHNKINMEALRGLYERLRLRQAQTYVQSGNVVFKCDEGDLNGLAKRIEVAIEHDSGFRPAVILRTHSELRSVVARNPFATRADVIPGKLAVTFLAGDPRKEALGKLLRLKADPEEVHADGSQLYIHFPNGMGRSKLFASLDKAISVPGTSRNWNTVLKLLEMADGLERDGPRDV